MGTQAPLNAASLAPSGGAQAVALERLHLGLGYDYDPEVVTALERAVASR